MESPDIKGTKSKEEKVALVHETVAFYETHERCIEILEGPYSRCMYYTPSKPWGCAVGRLCPEEIRKNLPSGGVNCVWVFLPDEVKVWGAPFLTGLQALHDVHMYWENGKLTGTGVLEMKRLINYINSGIY